MTDDLDVLGALVKHPLRGVSLAGKHPTYGYRRLSTLLRASRKKRYAQVNAKRVRRLLKTAGIQAQRPRRAITTTDSRHGFKRYPNLISAWSDITAPDDVWVVDITYIVLASGEIVYLAVVMDVFTRMIRGWQLSQACTHELCLVFGGTTTRAQTGRVQDSSLRPRSPICHTQIHSSARSAWHPDQHGCAGQGMGKWTV